MPKRTDKKLVLVPGDLVAQLLEIAARRGKSFSTFLEEDLQQVVRVGRMETSLKEVVDFFEMMLMLKSAGATFTPAEVSRFLVRAVPPEGWEKLAGKWYESGQWFGKFLIAKFQDRIDALERLLRASRWDLEEVKVTRGENGVEVRCISESLPLEETECLRNFIEGSMDSLGYGVRKRDSTRGIIYLEFEGSEKSRP